MKSAKKSIAVITGILLSMSQFSGINQKTAEKVKAAESVIAFPGAVGGGRYATGGRGGEVVHVTNLNDSGEGSFREAVSKPNRIVVFDVSGTIELEGNILVSNNVTIAGQTAPGGSGITLKNYKMGMSGDNIICRFVSSRPGPYKSTSSGNDAWGGAKGSNSIIDHCSMSWTTDEQWGLYSNNEYYTVQYSVIGPSDSWGGHSKGIHGFGMMMGNGYLTFDHNLIVHNVSRNFRGKVPGTKTADFTNNVIYNWAYETAYGTIGHLNYVGNTLKMGNGTTGGKRYVNVDSSTSPQNFKIFLTGNRMLNKDGSVYGDITYNNWAGITVKDGLGITVDSVKSTAAFQTIVNGINVSTATTAESAEASYENVLTYAGNGISSNLRTAVDKQVAYETRTGTGNLSGTASYNDADSTQKANLDKYHIQCGVTYTYPSPVLTKTITDTDNDGMPDQWELDRGLDPNDPTDTTGDYCGQGYTNIEYYINDLTVDAFPEGVVKISPKMAAQKPISAFEKIEAENFSDQSGTQTEECSEGGENVGYIEAGDYLVYRNVDFTGGANSFTARLAGNAAGIELYLDSLSNAPVAKLKFNGTENWQDWQDITFGIKEITGKHTLYIKFTGGEGYLLNINNFIFGHDAIPVDGRLIKDLKILDSATENDWYISDNTQISSIIYGDRDFTYTDFPAEMNGAESLITACNAKNNTTSDLAKFTAGQNITVYVAIDTRVENTPSWLEGWTKTEFTCHSSNDVNFAIWSKDFSTGDEVILGTNGQSYMCMNYSVFVTERKNSSEPEKLKGDTDNDGKVDSLDLILLRNHLLGISELSTEAFNIADINGDDTVNICDFILLKEILIS